jgi:hypothetical protein
MMRAIRRCFASSEGWRWAALPVSHMEGSNLREGRSRWFRTARLGVWLVAALLLLAAAASAVLAQDTGTLEGQVVNGTGGGPSIGEGITVTLHVLQGDSEIDTKSTTTDANGSFSFEGLSTATDLEYWPEASYLNVLYSGDTPYQFQAGQATLTATVTVYETTDDPSVVRLDQVHMIAESYDQVLRITEIHLFGNSSDRTYIGRDGATVSVPLPQDAVGLAFDQDATSGRFTEVDGGFVDSAPVPPGEGTSMVFFSYHLPVSGTEVSLERQFAYSVANLNMLVTQPGLILQTTQLQAQGTEQFQDRAYGVYVAQSVAAGTPLQMVFTVAPGASTTSTTPGASASGGQGATGSTASGSQAFLRWLGFALAGLAILAGVVYTTAYQGSALAAGSTARLAKSPKAQRLLAELADLEDAFESGQIDEAAYESQRQTKYEALKSS